MPAVFHPMPWGVLYVEEQGDALTRIQFLRPEEKFPDLNALRNEIARNVEQTRTFFRFTQL